MNNSKKLTEGALLTGIYLVLLLVTMFVPIIGGLLFFVLPVPFIMYSYRHGWKPAGVMFVAALILTVVFALPMLPATLLAGIGGGFLGSAIHHKRSPYETWAIGTVGYMIGLLGIYLSSQLLFDINWAEEYQATLNEAFDMSAQMMEGFLNTEESQAQLEALREQFNSLPDLIPSLFVLFGLLFSLVSQWLTYKIANRIERNKSFKFPPVKEFTLPTSLLWYYFLSMITMYLTTEESGLVYLAAINVFTLTGILIVLQGFSFLFFYADKKNWSKAIVLALLLPQIFLYFIRILGIIDIGFSLRKRLQDQK